MFSFESEVARINAALGLGGQRDGLPLLEIPTSIRRGNMAAIYETYVGVTIAVFDCSHEWEAKVRYTRNAAMSATVERGSGVHTQAAEPESVEILSVIVAKTDIMHLLTDAQLQAVAAEILEGE